MLSIAFKEWAVICQALGEGRQSLVLRKGGIAEEEGRFRPENEQFLLYPTHFHEQHRTGIKPDLLPMLDAAEPQQRDAGRICLTHFAAVSQIWHVEELDKALALNDLHGWTAEEVVKRFRYRTPGLYVLAVRVHRLAESARIVERPEYAGCKTWVHLDAPTSTDGEVPVLSDERFTAVLGKITQALS
jgi:hypothetical protein